MRLDTKKFGNLWSKLLINKTHSQKLKPVSICLSAGQRPHLPFLCCYSLLIDWDKAGNHGFLEAEQLPEAWTRDREERCWCRKANDTKIPNRTVQYEMKSVTTGAARRILSSDNSRVPTVYQKAVSLKRR